ncbi:MAG: hypothetical protein CMD22_05965 [Flavobacteriales bacterium]|nr:hypothetical protein [Flavobacteriales bacterium]
MKKLIFIFYFIYFIPIFTYSQVIITTNFIERTDTQKKTTDILDLSISSFIGNDLLIGLTNEDAVADYIQEGFNPIVDSFIVSDFQLFFKYYHDKSSFFILKIPTSSDAIGVSVLDRIRVGVGYVFYSENNFDFDISYDLLLRSNINGWKKGRLTIGVSAITDVKFPKISFHSHLFHRFVNWINSPLKYGYRESMYLTKSN